MTRRRAQLSVSRHDGAIARDRRAGGLGADQGPSLVPTRGVSPTSGEDPSYPRCLTVAEIMGIYRISRCSAYAQAALYLRRGAGHGIPCVKIGNSVRFPAAWIEAHIGAQVMGRSVHARGRSTGQLRSDGSPRSSTQNTLETERRDVAAPRATRRR